MSFVKKNKSSGLEFKYGQIKSSFRIISDKIWTKHECTILWACDAASGWSVLVPLLHDSIYISFLYHSRDQVSIFARLCISIMLLWREGSLTSLLRLLLACEPFRSKYRRKANQYQSSSYRWDEVKSSRPPGRKHLLLFETVGVIRWHKGRVLNQILLDADFSLFLSLVSLAILACAAQRALHTPTCSCTFFYWRYENVSLLTQTCTRSWAKCVVTVLLALPPQWDDYIHSFFWTSDHSHLFKVAESDKFCISPPFPLKRRRAAGILTHLSDKRQNMQN